MSGKGKLPRVKGNLKPTSSSRAADLVGDDTAAINAFKANPALAFAQLSQGLARSGAAPGRTGSPTAHTPDAQSGASTPQQQLSVLDQIDAQLAAQLKRLGKHDANTKMRALAELRGYIAEHTWETGLEGMLLAWPPLLRRHVFDTDRRVRMAIAQVHADLVVKVGRRLASQLKQLIGPWLASYFDPSRDIARCSRQAFEAAFSESKRKEVISFCIPDLLAFAADNIVEQTAESLSDPRATDPEEIRSKYEHVVGASFGVLMLAVDEMAPDRLLEHRPAFDAVLTSKRALALVASPSLFVRRSIYRLVRSVMLRCPALAADSHAAVAQALLKHCFADADPGAHGDMWDAVLLTTKAYPQVWAAGDASGKKGSPPIGRVFEFLRLRCRLSPTISYPSILALLANLPDSVLDEPSFQPSLHSALWHGAGSFAGGADASDSRVARQDAAAALVSAICECSSFLWTRSLKAAAVGDAAVVAAVGKEAAKEVDRLWHFYVQHAGSSKEMAEPIVQLFRKVESLSNKYDDEMLTSVWAQASWFALKRVSGDATVPIVSLVARLAHLELVPHRRLVDGARMLLEAFCQLARQSPDATAARTLIQALAQQAPEAVFHGSHADAFATRLAAAGTPDDVVALALAKAHFGLESTGSAAEAAKCIDSFVSPLLDGARVKAEGGGSLVTASKLLAALPESDVAKSAGWAADARLPAVDAALAALLPGDHGGLAAAPQAELVALFGHALGLFFSEARLLSSRTADSLFGWMAQVFVDVCGAQQSASVESASAGWEAACGEVLRAWTALARAPASGARFVHYWLQQSGGRGRAALGLLFDYAEPPADADADAEDSASAGWALAHRAHQAWAAVESRLGKLGLGAELSRALGEAIAQDVDDLRARRDPEHLARLAGAVYARICPQDDESTLAGLVGLWLLYAPQLAGPDEQAARAACVAGGSGLWQAVEDGASTGSDMSFHTVAHWQSATGGSLDPALPEFDVAGRSQAARRAIFGIEFVRRAGGLGVLAGADREALAAFVLRMALAFVMLREALLLASSNAGWSAAEAGSRDRRMVAQVSIIRVDGTSAAVLAQADNAARSIQDTVSDLLELVAVHELPLPGRGEKTSTKTGVPRDAGRWLGTLMERVLDADSAAADSVWSCAVEQCAERCRGDAGSPWVVVLGRLAQWCQWAHPLPAMCVEAEVADALSRRLASGRTLEAGVAAMATVVARAVALRHACARAPAMRSSLLDVASQLSGAAAGGDAVLVTAHLELLAELLPAREAAVEAATAVAKIVSALSALRGDSVAGAVAGLAVVQRLAACAAAMDADSAVALARLCVRWSELDAGELGEAAVLSAVGRATSELAQAASRILAESRPAIGTALRQLGERLVDVCVLGERPVAAGAQAVAQLAESGFAAVPELSRLFPVLASAPPRLNAALVRLALAAEDRAAYAGVGMGSLVRLVLAAAKTLAGLVATPAGVGSAAEADEFVRAAGVRLLSALFLAVQFAEALQDAAAATAEGEAAAAAGAERSEELSELLARERVLDVAMPWVCGLLGLAAGQRAFEAQRWDVSAQLDWQAWAAVQGAGLALEVLALHVVVGLARTFPATLRAWWTGLPQAQRATGAAMEQFVARHVSVPVGATEMERVRSPAGALARVLEEYDDAQVRAGARQATITYTVDDCTLELAVRLPSTYPLAPAVLDAVRRVAVPESRWRAWVVAAQAQMARNCRMDAVCARIVGNIGAHFAGVEDCAICYSAVGALDGSLPSKQCHTCKNSFHRACLYKWFRTSNQSSCPLCRNLF
ncbi:hypothetical protein LPJ61_000857 [Coemansia biformis]|uniref:E3 ubiquitin-protein ligase listerin n=1 Tax=Coemansia biformis TaxID=1286918 RepID=A0A9W7YHJ7_9FUNG|nr:hypothetical protein LPJ61_000857 [Coemansia biformis]